MVARFPELSPGVRQVRNEDNGLLQLSIFLSQQASPDDGPSDASSLEFGSPLAHIYQEPFDLSGYSAWRSLHADELKELMRICLLPGTSSRGMTSGQVDRVHRVFEGRLIPLLAAESRYQVIQANSQKAAQAFQALAGLIRIAYDDEAAGFPDWELDRNGGAKSALEVVSREVLSRGQWTEDDLRAWQQALPSATCDDLKEALRRDWQYEWCRTGEDGNALEVGDPFASGETERDGFTACSELTAAMIQQVQRLSLGDLRSAGYLVPNDYGWEDDFPGCSRGMILAMRRKIEVFANLSTALAQVKAATAIALGGQPPIEPVSGLPFLIEAENRTVSLPNDPRLERCGLQPFAIPRLATK